jgi:hypothetical protein
MGLSESIAKFDFGSSDACPFQTLLNKLSKEDQAVIANAFERGVSGYAVCKALRSEGYRIAEVSVYDHRKKICRCFKKS